MNGKDAFMQSEWGEHAGDFYTGCGEWLWYLSVRMRPRGAEMKQNGAMYQNQQIGAWYVIYVVCFITLFSRMYILLFYHVYNYIQLMKHFPPILLFRLLLFCSQWKREGRRIHYFHLDLYERKENMLYLFSPHSVGDTWLSALKCSAFSDTLNTRNIFTHFIFEETEAQQTSAISLITRMSWQSLDSMQDLISHRNHFLTFSLFESQPFFFFSGALGRSFLQVGSQVHWMLHLWALCRLSFTFSTFRVAGPHEL